MPKARGFDTGVQYPRLYVHTLAFAAATREKPFALLCWLGLASWASQDCNQKEYSRRLHHWCPAQRQNDRGLLPCILEASAVGGRTWIRGHAHGGPQVLSLCLMAAQQAPRNRACAPTWVAHLPAAQQTHPERACAPTRSPSFGSCSPRISSGSPGFKASRAPKCGRTGPYIFALFQSCYLMAWLPDSLV